MQLSESNKEIRGVAVDYPGGKIRVRITVRDSDGENYQVIEVDEPEISERYHKSLPGHIRHKTKQEKHRAIEEKLKGHVSHKFGIKKDQVIIPRHVIIKME